MSSVRVLVGCVIAGKRYSAGDIADVPDADAQIVVRMRAAEPYTAPAAPPSAEQIVADEAALAQAEAEAESMRAKLAADLQARGE
jgi:hypothetical protein